MARHSRQPEASWEDSYEYGRNNPGPSAARHAQPNADWGYPSISGDAAQYSRDAYGAGGSRGKGSRNRRRGGAAKKVVIGVLALIVLLVAAVGIYAAVFESRIHGNLSTPEQMAEVLTPASNSEPYYILLLGSDWRENSGTSDKAEMSGDQQRADVIILARMDPANKQVTLVSVPRDTRWQYEGSTYKINEAYNIGGAALETQAISELTGVSIAHTVETHFSGLEALVDALGGVEVDVPQTISYKDALTGEKVKVEAGKQVLNGQEAQIFARVRKAYGGEDSKRQGNVRTLVLAIADTIREKPFFTWPGLGLKIADCLGTDMSMGDFMSLMANFGSGGLTLYSGTGPTAGEIDYVADPEGIWLCYENPDGWKAVMDVVDSGGDPSSIDPDSIVSETASDYTYAYDEYGNYLGGYYDEYGNFISDYSEDYYEGY